MVILKEGSSVRKCKCACVCVGEGGEANSECGAAGAPSIT